jgi:hypothetical protein
MMDCFVDPNIVMFYQAPFAGLADVAGLWANRLQMNLTASRAP